MLIISTVSNNNSDNNSNSDDNDNYKDSGLNYYGMLIVMIMAILC